MLAALSRPVLLVLYKLKPVQRPSSPCSRSLIAPDYVILQNVLNFIFTFMITRSLNLHASSLDYFSHSLTQDS